MRLLPDREVPTSINLVEVNQVGIRALCPAPRSLTQLLPEHGHRGPPRFAGVRENEAPLESTASTNAMRAVRAR